MTEAVKDSPHQIQAEGAADSQPGSANPLLPGHLTNVSYAIGPKPLLKDITLTFTAGKRSLILGPNGAGKSLLLRICHGLLPASSGEISWQVPNPEAARQQALVFQKPVLLRRSVAANLDHALSLQGLRGAAGRRRRQEALDHCGLSAQADQAARLLSGGEQQRLALARVWALRPRVLFLDEPTASLDPAATRIVEGLIQDLHNEGCKIIMTTHDLGQARRLADEIIFLHQGQVHECSPAKQFFDQPTSPQGRAFLAGDLLV
ncbi:ATP-binding cassette domain-containing protein [Rhodovibrionaceae bacterium A322]